MPRKPISYGLVYKGREMYALLIEKERESRSYSKKQMLKGLNDPELYLEFLKISMEHDFSDDLKTFRRALYLVLTAIGMSKAAKETKIPRTTLYRMLWSGGNPNLKYLLRVYEFLGLRAWVVSEDFVYSNRTPRFRDAMPDPDDMLVGHGRRIKPRQPEY